MQAEVSYFERPDGLKLAYRYSPPAPPGESLPVVMFCGGYRSDMNGTKATYLEAQCRARGQGYLRFDYSGHGRSGGFFEDGTIGAWMSDALCLMDGILEGPVVLAGSSMGGWIALLLAQARPEKIHAIVGIAAAPDFTRGLYEGRLSEKQKQELLGSGRVEIPNDYSDEPYIFTKKFYEESKSHVLLNRERHLDCPVRLIQGVKDKDVPWETAVRIQKSYKGTDVHVLLVDDGDHSLSRPEDLELIDKEIRGVSSVF